MIKYELDLEEFMKNIKIEDKNFSQYEDIKGNYFELNTVQLITRVDYLELETEKIGKTGASEYEQALFSQKINDLKYNKKNIKKKVPKSEITGKKEDMYIITEKKSEVVEVWNVSNPYGAFKSFTDKKEALKLAKEINKSVKKVL